VLFADLRGFTKFTASHSATQVVETLNLVFNELVEIVFQNKGTFDKFLGDAVMAFYGAPIIGDDDAERALRSALDMQRCFLRLQSEDDNRILSSLGLGIGVHSGEVVVGNMGSRDRFDYTVLGDAANLASRLEGANKAFGTYLMVSEDTWSRTGGSFVGRELGRLRVVGRKTPVTVFEPWGWRGENPPPGWKEFANALALCYQGEWVKALAVFNRLADDPPAQVYAKKCREIIDTPGSSWDGIWNLTEK